MKDMFGGIREVFSFTFVQNIKTKSFKLVVILVSVLLFTALFAINLGTGLYKENKHKKKKPKEAENGIEKLYFANQSDMKNFDVSDFGQFSEFEKKLQITDAGEMEKKAGESATMREILAKADENEEKVVVFVLSNHEEIDNCYELLVSRSKTCKKAQVENLADDFLEYFDTYKFKLAGIEEDSMKLIMSGNRVNSSDIADSDKSLAQILIEVLMPMIVVLLMYMLVLIHGQSISKIIVVEKNSKLMETLLISVRPYAIIAGKVLAMYLVAVIEMTSWVVSAVLGYFISDKLANRMFTNYKNPVTMLLNIIKDNINETFGAGAVILCVVSVLVGFMIYCVLSAMIAANITKAEELANSSGIYQVIVAIGYLAAYFVPLSIGSDSLLAKIIRYIPVTSPFMLPADVLIGYISIPGAIVSNLILLVTMMVMIFFTGKIYKNKVF